MLKDHNDQGVIWKCLACEYQTKFKPVLYEHVESKHIDSVGYNCPHCVKFCRTRNALRSHISRQHSEFSVKKGKHWVF